MKKLKLTNYAGYAMGDFANNLAFAMQSMFLLLYYTSVVGLNPAVVGTMMGLIRIWDALSDLVAGRLVDITRSRWGKFRPYLLFGSLPLLVMSVLLFSVPGFDSMTLKYVYAIVTYFVFGFMYSLVNIPYGSLATSMTQDTIERSKLGVWRGIGPLVATMLLVFVVSPQIKKYATDPAALQHQLTIITAAFVVVGYLAYLVTFFTCKEQISHEGKPITLKETFGVIRTNRPLLILCLSNLVFLTGIFSVQGSQAFFAQWVLGDANMLIWMTVASSIGSLLAVPLVPAAVARMGKKQTFLVSAGLTIALGTWIFFLPVTKPLVVATFFCWGLVQNLGMSLLFAFEADAVDYGEWKSGERTEGAVYSVYSFFRKMSQALSASVVGWILAAGSFASKGAKVQPDSALTAVRACVGLCPAIFGLLGAAIFLTYPLTDARLKEIVAELHQRRGIVDERDDVATQAATVRAASSDGSEPLV